MKQRTKKIIIWTSIGLLFVGAIVGVSLFIYYNTSKTKEDNSSNNNNEPIKYNLDDANPDDIGARTTMFNVDQADASLIQVKKSNNNYIESDNENFDILIDVGVKNRAPNEEKDKLINSIKSSGVNHLDLIVISHAHFDHLGALERLTKATNDHGQKMIDDKTSILVNFQEYLFDKATSTAKKAMKAVFDTKARFIDAKDIASKVDNKIVNFGQYGYLSVLTPLIDQSPTSPNDWSIINRFEFNNKSVLYTGDATGKTTKSNNWLPSHLEQFDVDILKSPHHGSATDGSNSMEFLNMVTPSQVWISAGHSDKYTLPDVTALENYLKIGVLEQNIKGTDYFGNKNTEDQSVWQSLNEWLKKHPDVNNHNQGYVNGIIEEF